MCKIGTKPQATLHFSYYRLIYLTFKEQVSISLF